MEELHLREGPDDQGQNPRVFELPAEKIRLINVSKAFIQSG